MKISNESVLAIFCAYITARPIKNHGQLIEDVAQLVADYEQVLKAIEIENGQEVDA